MGDRGEQGGWNVYEEVAGKLFAMSDAVRYVAFGEGQRVESHQREGIENASASDSDRFEELFVNPALVTLGRQRGDLDCGGLRYIMVAYGSFNQVILPTLGGHVSVALERSADAERLASAIGRLLDQQGRADPG
jgi:hypothetical protein